MSELALKISGLTELRKGLRGIDKGLPKVLRLAGNAGADLLIAAARPKIASRSGAARASLRASSTQSVSRVSAGGPKAPYYPWLDFGGRTGRRKRTVRPFYSDGRYIYPTLAEQRDKIQDAMLAAFAEIAEGAGVQVDG